MKLSTLLLSTVALIGVPSAYAADSHSSAPSMPITQPVNSTAIGPDMGGLIGHRIVSASGDRLGRVDAILATREGRINTVIVNNGNRDVALPWKQLRFADNGRKVFVNMTKDQMKALPDYRYTATATDDNSVMTPAPAESERTSAPIRTTSDMIATPAKPASHAAKPKLAAAPAKTTVAKAMTPPDKPELKTAVLIGRSVNNTAGDQIGRVEDLSVDKSGRVHSVIVGVGGFLGVGERNVALNWDHLKISDNGNKVLVDMTKDELKALPVYDYKTTTTTTTTTTSTKTGLTGVPVVPGPTAL